MSSSCAFTLRVKGTGMVDLFTVLKDLSMGRNLKDLSIDGIDKITFTVAGTY